MPWNDGETARTCYRCRKPLVLSDHVGRREMCPACGADLHVCLNCRFYDPGVYNACGEPQAERVLEKERANFCDYFDFRKGSVAAPAPPTDPSSAKNRLEALFPREKG
jgi:hypothetical protein